MKKKKPLIGKIIVVALILFFPKHLLQASIEWTDIIPVRPKLYIWENEQLPLFRIVWEFVFTFWLYVIYSALTYYAIGFIYKKDLGILKFKAVNFLFLVGILLLIHRNDFPYQKLLSLTNPKKFNLKFFEELLIFSTLILTSVYSVRYLIFRKDIYSNKD